LNILTRTHIGFDLVEAHHAPGERDDGIAMGGGAGDVIHFFPQISQMNAEIICENQLDLRDIFMIQIYALFQHDDAPHSACFSIISSV
jgi:hypothetical protein